MSDSLEPPAKRARLEADAPFFGASATAQDAPGSPVDDLDDDFYDTTPVKSLSHAAAHDQAAVFAAAASAPSGFHLPGLGSVSETPAAPQPQTAAHSSSTVAHAQRDDASEDGELSDDDDAFYNDESAFDAPAANHAPGHVEAPHQDGEQSRSDAHGEFTSTTRDAAAADTPAVDTDGELDAALAAAIDEQNDAQDAADDLAIANAHAAGFDSKAEFLAAAEANRDDKNAEWQLDSDASDSNSDSTSSSSDDSSDEDGSDEGELLDPEEQIRLLMAEVADEPGATKAKVKTLNEQDEQYEKPDITVTDATKITELGKVESVVENLVVIKAKVSGDFQVLESGSALCLQNRTVIGKVSEQIGRVEDPRYSIGFNDLAEIETLGIAKDTPIYYVNEHSTFVETEPLRRQKHTDASNLHDEETNDVEFSDDEKEAEYKREQKAKKRARTEDNEDRPKLPIPTGPRGHVDAPMRYQSTEYQGGGLKYSDDEDDDDMGMYKPLARPDHFEQIVGHGAPLEDRSHVRRGMGRGRGPWGDRGRGMRGRGGFGGRGDFGGGQANRGNFGQGRGDFGGGRGDRGGHRGDRGGHGNNRGDKGGDRGGRGGKQQNDRGRHQEQFHEQQHNQQKNGPQHGGRSATSASPARQQQDRGQSQSRQNQGQSQMQQSSAAGGGKNKNRKQRQREKRERERQQQQQNHQQNQQKQQASPAPSGPSNTNAYAGNSGANWPVPFSNPSQPAQAYAAAADPPPPSAAAAPVAPPFPQAAYGGQAPATGQAQQQQGSWEAWAQWFQVVGAMSQQAQPQQQHQQPQAYAPAPPQPAPQPQAQYPYQYQQFAQQQPVAPPQPQQQAQGQAAQPTLQDILRALGQQGAAPR